MKFNIVLLLLAGTCLSFGQSPPDKTKTSGDTSNATQASPAVIEGKVKIVLDGDTFGMEAKDHKAYTIRLQCIDAPESGQDFGETSRKKLADLIDGEKVVVVVSTKDHSNRYIGAVYLSGVDVGLKQIEYGMAWHFKQDSYKQSSQQRKDYAQAEIKARENKIGLWQNFAPMPPWEFRGDETTAAQNPTTVDPKPVNALVVTPSKDPPPATNSSLKRTYILGPRGGCYYVGESGSKVYLKDKSLCTKQ